MLVVNIGDNIVIGACDEVVAQSNWSARTNSFQFYREKRAYMNSSGENPCGVEIEYLSFARIPADGNVDIRRVLINHCRKNIKVSNRLLTG